MYFFSVWLLSLRVGVPPCGLYEQLTCSLSWVVSIRQIHHNLLMYLPADGHSGCFQFLVVTYKTAVNTACRHRAFLSVGEQYPDPTVGICLMM